MYRVLGAQGRRDMAGFRTLLIAGAFASLSLGCSSSSPPTTPPDIADSHPEATIDAAIDATLASRSNRVTVTMDPGPESRRGPETTIATLDHIGAKRVSFKSGDGPYTYRVVDGVVYSKDPRNPLWMKDVQPILHEWDQSTLVLSQIRKHGVIGIEGPDYTFSIPVSNVIFHPARGRIRIENGRIASLSLKSDGDETRMAFAYISVPPIEAPPASEISSQSTSERCSSSGKPGDTTSTVTCTDSLGRKTVTVRPIETAPSDQLGDDAVVVTMTPSP
jgi:hypothetical protein